MKKKRNEKEKEEVKYRKKKKKGQKPQDKWCNTSNNQQTRINKGAFILTKRIEKKEIKKKNE